MSLSRSLIMMLSANKTRCYGVQTGFGDFEVLRGIEQQVQRRRPTLIGLFTGGWVTVFSLMS